MHPATAEMISRLQHEERLREAQRARRHQAAGRASVRTRLGTWLIRAGERLVVPECRYETAT